VTHGIRTTPVQPSPNTEPWPEGTIARYLTVGGATVNVSAHHTAYEVGEHGTKSLDNGISLYTHPEKLIDLTITAQCTGCPDHEVFESERLYPSALDRIAEGPYGRAAARWAQAHAERCRALPRPTAVTT
jgi:hypothetical protein